MTMESDQTGAAPATQADIERLEGQIAGLTELIRDRIPPDPDAALRPHFDMLEFHILSIQRDFTRLQEKVDLLDNHVRYRRR